MVGKFGGFLLAALSLVGTPSHANEISCATFLREVFAYGYLESVQGALTKELTDVLVPVSHPRSSVHAYVLMSNHFHLIVETPKANLSEFMRQFNISSTGYCNRRHRRIGHLYQGRYEAIVVDKDSYLLELSRYVHLNPIRIKSKMQRPARERTEEILRYRWSSLTGYIDGKRQDSWITYGTVLASSISAKQFPLRFLRDVDFHQEQQNQRKKGDKSNFKASSYEGIHA